MPPKADRQLLAILLTGLALAALCLCDFAALVFIKVLFALTSFAIAKVEYEIRAAIEEAMVKKDKTEEEINQRLKKCIHKISTNLISWVIAADNYQTDGQVAGLREAGRMGGGAAGEIKVNHDEVRICVNSLRKSVDAMDEVLATLRTALADLEGGWSGPSFNKYQEAANHVFDKKLEASKDKLAELARMLEESDTTFGEVDSLLAGSLHMGASMRSGVEGTLMSGFNSVSAAADTSRQSVARNSATSDES
ncbi:MAG: WXG100 family type VII secretion target [Coriobacteriales bacterium]|nr:WXG100 family type VII secretion target [Coriobacteriales bacterium]